MTRTHAVLDSPIGPLTVVTSAGDVVGLYLQDHAHPPSSIGARGPVPPEVERQLAAYFAGTLREFDLPLATAGTPFQERVWAALREVPYGETTTYGALAGALGMRGGARAVGLANGRNPISIVVPCHRVVGADGSLTGYAGGVERKRALLALERSSTD